eukprot:gene27699-31293_t
MAAGEAVHGGVEDGAQQGLFAAPVGSDLHLAILLRRSAACPRELQFDPANPPFVARLQRCAGRFAILIPSPLKPKQRRPPAAAALSLVAAGAAASHVYNAGGSYTASLKVTDSAGFSGTSTVVITATTVQPKVYAGGITMALVAPNRTQAYAQAKVTVKDASGKVIPNATVSGSWSGIGSAASPGAGKKSSRP